MTGSQHHAFTQTLIEELGEEKGKALALKAIRGYRGFVGQNARKRAEEKGLPFARWQAVPRNNRCLRRAHEAAFHF